MIGIDEVGRGCWAGPLLVVAARLVGALPEGLADSKTLSHHQRESLLPDIRLACDIGEGWVQPEEIDESGLAAAMRTGVSRALIALGATFDDEIIMDGNINYCPIDFHASRAIIKADIQHGIVSAASVYAKVTRDKYMRQVARFYPVYQFEKHVGYGTKLHQEMLEQYGVSAIHRRSYKPIQVLLS